MTYKKLADLLGVKKDKVRYLAEQLPVGTVQKIDGVMHLSNHAIDAVVSAINGGELESGVEIPPYDPGDPVGWDWTDIPEAAKTAELRDSARNFTHEQTASAEYRGAFRTEETVESGCETEESAGNFASNEGDSAQNATNSHEIPHEQAEDCENPQNAAESATSREIAEYYQRAFLTFTDHYNQQIKSKDEQIKQLTEQLGIMASAIADRDKAHDADTAEQLTAKDSQIQRMQDTIDTLTRQLEAERRRAEQGSVRKWWQWWKR